MKLPTFVLSIALGAGLLLAAGSNLHCSTLERLLADGGTPVVGGDGGGVIDLDGGGLAAKGSVALTLTCTGDACGKTGQIIARVKVCGAGGAEQKREILAGQTLTMGTPIMVNLPDIEAGNFCVRAYLDVNMSGMQDMGDIIGTMDEVMITVAAGMATAVTVDLTMVKP